MQTMICVLWDMLRVADHNVARLMNMSSEVFVSAPPTGVVKFEESAQSFGRMCDLLFFGDEMPVSLALVELLPEVGPGLSLASIYAPHLTQHLFASLISAISMWCSDQGEAFATGATGRDRVLSCLFSIFIANDQVLLGASFEKSERMPNSDFACGR